MGQDADVAILIDLSLSIVDHIGEDVGGCLAILRLLLCLGKLTLELFKLRQLVLDGLLLENFLSPLICNLSLCSSPLDACLEHVRSIPLLG